MYEIVIDPKVASLNAILQKKALSFVQSTYQMLRQLEFLVLQTLTKKVGESLFEGHTMKVDSNLWLQAHHYVLENTTIIQPYVE